MAGKGAFYSLPRPTYNAQILAQKGVWGELAKAKSQECCTATLAPFWQKATLVSTGTTFRFEDDLDDVWGEVSAGVNFFNPSASTAVFAKLDVTFGDDLEGIDGKAGMRVSW